MSKQSTLVNSSDAADHRTLPDGVEKVEWAPDTRFRLCGSFTIYLEDHTLGNILKTQLLKDPDVMFVGYRIPHPLENKLEVRLRTSSKEPLICMYEAAEEMKKICSHLKIDFP
ncbi:Dna-directed Rna polymerase II RPB11A, partial [Cardiosporidium cionae]